MEFFQIFSLIVAVAVLKTEAFPKKDEPTGVDAVGSISNNHENILSIDAGKNIVKRQVVPGPTGPGQYGGTWNSKDGKTQIKSGIDFNQAPNLGWHADVNRRIYTNPSGKVNVDAFAGAKQPFNQIGKTPDVHGGIRVNFR